MSGVRTRLLIMIIVIESMGARITGIGQDCHRGRTAADSQDSSSHHIRSQEIDISSVTSSPARSLICLLAAEFAIMII